MREEVMIRKQLGGGHRAERKVKGRAGMRAKPHPSQRERGGRRGREEREKPQLLFKIREQLYAWSRCHGNCKEKETEALAKP